MVQLYYMYARVPTLEKSEQKGPKQSLNVNTTVLLICIMFTITWDLHEFRLQTNMTALFLLGSGAADNHRTAGCCRQAAVDAVASRGTQEKRHMTQHTPRCACKCDINTKICVHVKTSREYSE